MASSSTHRLDEGRSLLFGDLWTYAPAPESQDVVKLRPIYGHFIGNTWEYEGETFASINPATEQPLCQIHAAGAEIVDRAVSAAQDAYTSIWKHVPALERGKYLYRIGRAIQERALELAVLESMDNGKPIRESRDVDIPLAAAHFLYYAGWADKLAYAFPGASARPCGVVGQVIPWNFPLLMAAWKIAPALAAGNTVVLKPAETSPLTACFLAEICADVGLPPGVVNIIHGATSTGAALVDHPGINKVAFTGSTEVGKKILAATAGTPKSVTLELGGKGANIIFADAALEQAVEGVVRGIFFNQGHVCCAGSRVLVQESLLEPLIERLLWRMKSLRVGDPLDKNTDVGAIHSQAQLQKIHKLVNSGIQEGATITQMDCALPAQGYFFPPTIFRDVAQSHRIAQEEIFGPVLSILTFRTAEEAVHIANNTAYGLSAGIWTQKGSKNFAIAGALRAGVVWGNTFNQFDPASPFGGYKESGIGREGGLHGLLPYLQLEGID
ncbi:MAG: aldehyde dehydrogenase family protein [Myxococcota bacterium]